MNYEIPLVIKTLSERLHFRFTGPKQIVRIDVFSVDLSDWKLNLSEHTPFLWIHKPEHLGMSSVDLAAEIQDLARQQAWRNEQVFVVVEDDAEQLRATLHRSFSQFIVIDNKQQKDIWDTPSPTRILLDITLSQIPRSRLSPYDTSRPVTGSRFFGRESIIKKITAHSGSSYLVVGIRRIGKSSILKETERRLGFLNPPAEGKTLQVYIDCSVIGTVEEFFHEVIIRLQPSQIKHLLRRSSESLYFQSRIFDFLAASNGGRITYLLDEVDNLINGSKEDWGLFKIMRKSSYDGTGRFVMAGFRELRRTLGDRESPFYNFGDIILLESLDRAEAKQMIEFPMDQLRVKIENRDEIVRRIYDETGGLPNLIALYCQTLLEKLDKGDRHASVISLEDLQLVYQDSVFRDFIANSFLFNASPLERAIVFALMVSSDDSLNQEFSHEQIENELLQHGLPVLFSEIDEACKNLVSSGILLQHGKHLGFSLRLLPRMLQENYQIDYLLRKALQELMADS